MGGIDQRVGRHISDDKKTYWHIDYLLLETDIIDVLKKPSDKREECFLAGEVEKIADSIVKGFGCSDCKCPSHLFYFRHNPRDRLSLIFGQ